MSDLLVRGLSDRTVRAFKREASRQGRSLQQEVRMTLERLASLMDELQEDPHEVARSIKRELLASGQVFEDSAELVREDRDR